MFLLLCLIAFFGTGLVGRLIEPHVVFQPQKFPGGNWSLFDWNLPSGSRVEDVFFDSKDGTHLHGLYISAAVENGPVILYMHGNAGNVTHRRDWFEEMARRGISIFVFDYRGFGKSDGHPDEEGLYADAMSAYEYLGNQKHISINRLFVYGHSLGGAVAIDLASREPVAGLIIEASFTSIRAMASHYVPVYPFYWFLHSRFDSISKIPLVRSPVLIIQGDQDETVPFKLGRELYDSAKQPKEFYEIHGGGHDNLAKVGGTAYYDKLISFVTKVFSETARSSP
ncbi:MAG TPA: alpha/beta hydrolase [Blastocatellia bacterium]|nr:alpha/beta hydrolase [Blastocatellia bacterium]